MFYQQKKNKNQYFVEVYIDWKQKINLIIRLDKWKLVIKYYYKEHENIEKLS